MNTTRNSNIDYDSECVYLETDGKRFGVGFQSYGMHLRGTDLPHGVARIVWADSFVEEGHFVHGKLHGWGRKIYTNGLCTTNLWMHGFALKSK